MTVNHVAVGSNPTKRASLSINISMKPILIYTMPRTRGTATLQACNREVKLNEPFAIHSIPNYSLDDDDGNFYIIRTLTEYDQWDTLSEKMNQPNTAVKIFGHHLMSYYNARAWYKAAANTHEIFTLIRDPREIILSHLLATHFGFSKNIETEEKEIIIHDNQFHKIQIIIGSFLRFYPSSSRLVTFETLPDDTFDKSQIMAQEQHSMNRLHLIKNLDQVEKNIDSMLSYYRQEWKDVTGLDIHAPLAQR